MSRARRCIPASIALVCGILAALAVFAAASPALAVNVQRVAGGGVEAWLVEDHSNPIVTVRLAFRGGGALDPAGKEGLAEMVSALLDEGSGDLDSAAFQARLEDMAITLRFDADLDTFRGQLETLSENRDTAFAMLRDALTRPRFDAEPVARIRSQLQASLRGALEDPDTVATRAFFAMAYPHHPYGRPVDGTPESLAAIDVADLHAFAASRLTKDKLVIGVVGDITAAQLSEALEATFAGLPASGQPLAVAEAVPATAGQVKIVPTGSPQSAIVFGQRGVSRDSPDYYAATILSQILGAGSFTSRLYEEVREKRGLVYSVYAMLRPLDRSSLILGSAGTVNERVGETVDTIRSVWRAVAADGVGESEFADARTYLTGSFPLRFTSNGQIASILVSMQLEDLGIDYLDRRNALIEAVSIADVNRLARELLAPGNLAFVIAGDPAGVKATHQ